MYVFEVRKDISDSVLLLDSDTIFINKTDFIAETGGAGTIGFFNVGKEFYAPYFEHMERLIPGLTRQVHEYSGITHHMVFQRDIVEYLFDEVEKILLAEDQSLLKLR